MAELTAPVSFRKKNGTLSVSRLAIEWKPGSGGEGKALHIPLPQVTNLQQTPASSATVMIRVFVAGEDQPNYKFTFTDASASREQCSNMTAFLKEAVSAAAKDADEKPPIDPTSREALMGNGELQQALLKADANLFDVFRETVIKGTLSVQQFWEPRVPLLRSFHFERNQQRGPYNVLASVRPKTEDNTIKFSLTREQIRDMFEQQPTIQHVYNECVPKLPEKEFWKRFFTSRLCKKLRGERIAPGDPTDDILDAYLDYKEESKHGDEEAPATIDLEANAQDISLQARGNRPDLTMRPNSNVPVIHAINAISQRMLQRTGAAQRMAARADESDYLAANRLTDLNGDPEVKQILLKVQDEHAFFANLQTDDGGVDSKALAQQSYGTDTAGLSLQDASAELLRSLQLNKFSLKLAGSTPGGADKVAAAEFARMQREADAKSSSAAAALPSSIMEPLMMSHAAAHEYLRQFWASVLSSSGGGNSNVQNIARFLQKTPERVEAIANEAKEAGYSPEYVHNMSSALLSAVERALSEYGRMEIRGKKRANKT